MKHRVYLILLVLLATLIGYRLVANKTAAKAQMRQREARMKAPPPVLYGVARVQDIVRSVDSVGSVEAPLSVKIAAKVTGRIDSLQANEGDRVTAGQVLARIDPTQVEAQVRQAQAALAQEQYKLAQAKITQNPTDVSVVSQVNVQEAAVRSAQANLANAQRKLDRVQGLYDKGFVAAQDVDDTRTAVGVQQAVLDQARASLEYAKANTAQKPAYQQILGAQQAVVAAAQAALRNAESLRADTVLTSPFDGFVTARDADPGAVVTPGQPMLEVQYLRRVWVTMSVPEEVSGAIRLGRTAKVSLDSMPGREFVGKVTQVNASADPASRQFSVRVTLDNPDFALKPGTFAHIRIETEAVRGALVVPREAVQRDKSGSYVMVIGDRNIVARRPVTPGASDIDVIAIARGLRAGEKVVTMTAYPLKDGQVVSTSGGKRRAARGRPAAGASSWSSGPASHAAHDRAGSQR
jgi:multidrug efflux pump subunit AcrA (membrane-fusion protein)